MIRFKIHDAETFVAAIQDEISRTREGRYFHRLHVVLCVLQGYSTYEAARIYGDSKRAVQYWVGRLLSHGLAGLWDKEHHGRLPQLAQSNEQELRNDLLQSPRDLGYDQNLWDGPLLSHHIKERYTITLSVRQCQRLFHKFALTLQRPRRQPREADPLQREAFKKSSKNG